ncbi:MAG: tRNA lysidine(34) synthetase TilS [Thermosynechococcaceae cyanobacterium]
MNTRHWTPLHARFHGLLRQRKLLPKDQSILLGFSGGQDSMCLLKLLVDLQSKWGWNLAVVHCDHCWPLDSSKNAQYAADLIQQWQLPYFGRMAPKVLKGEAEGRDWRYQEMDEIARHYEYDAVVTAHTASDRTETLLYNLIRGSGADGLQALTWQRPLATGVQLVRPLLAVTRAETGQFCQDLDLPIWKDSMNQDLHYRRNRIRQDILPYFREHFNPNVDTTIAQTAELLQADVAYLETNAKELLAAATNQPLPSELAQDNQVLAALDRTVLQQTPLALQRRALRQFLQMHLQIAPNFAQVEKVTALISAPNRSRSDPITAQVIALNFAQHLCFYDLST